MQIQNALCRIHETILSEQEVRQAAVSIFQLPLYLSIPTKEVELLAIQLSNAYAHLARMQLRFHIFDYIH